MPNRPSDDGVEDHSWGTRRAGFFSFTRMTKIRVLCIALIVFLGPSVGLSASPFEAPTIGEVIGAQIGEALDAARAHVASKQAFGRKILVARTKFFELYPTGQGLEQAESEFAELLFSKDLYHLGQYVAEGTTPAAIKRFQGMEALTGGALDGGIPKSAWRSFSLWVNAVRRRLGARNPGELLFLMNAQKLVSAVETSTDEYESYKAKRDAAEFRSQGVEWSGPSRPTDGNENTINAGGDRPPSNSYAFRWDKACVAEGGSSGSPQSHKKWCNCLVDGLTGMETQLSTQTKEALAQSFSGSLSKVWNESRRANEVLGGCFQ